LPTVARSAKVGPHLSRRSKIIGYPKAIEYVHNNLNT
jgi:hypothetical protein